MRSQKPQSISRRALISGLIATPLAVPSFAQTPEATTSTPEPAFQFPEPITIHESIQVLDWRPFPHPEQPSFIAEIKNIGTEAIDSPTVGLLFEKPANTFAWGNPWNVTLAPGQSTFIFGSLDSDQHNQESLDTVTWMLCDDELSQIHIEKSPAPFVTWSDIQIDRRARWGSIEAILTNQSDTDARFFNVKGIFRDAQHRIAGSSLSVNIRELSAHESLEMLMYTQHFDIDTNWVSRNLSNPYHILEDNEEWTVELSVDARGTGINSSCPAVMPWNRDD